jgi:hypothetical protein
MKLEGSGELKETLARVNLAWASEYPCSMERNTLKRSGMEVANLAGGQALAINVINSKISILMITAIEYTAMNDFAYLQKITLMVKHGMEITSTSIEQNH